MRMNRQRWWWWLALWLLAAPVFADEGDEALVTGDYVRVRAEPSLTAPQLGFLYKNLRVRVLERSANTSMVDGKASYWYRVRQDNVEGWCSAAFLDFSVPRTAIDTYAAPADMDWFYSRFGGSTAFQDNTFNADSFSMDDYRRLIAATHESHAGTSAPLVLKLSIYRHLRQRPDDLKYQYLKPKLYSPEFLYDMVLSDQFDVLPLVPTDLGKQVFTEWLRRSPREQQLGNRVLAQIPESELVLRRALAQIMLTNSSRESDVRGDLTVVRTAVAGNGLLLKHATAATRDDFETVMTAVKNNPSAVQWASDRMKADGRIREIVGTKTIQRDLAPEGGLLE
jgi:hypothetical protein